MKKLLILIIILALGAVAVVVFLNRDSKAPSLGLKREEVLQQARDYMTPEGMACTQALTPAIHEKTGARFTFPSGCLAPGWRAE